MNLPNTASTSFQQRGSFLPRILRATVGVLSVAAFFSGTSVKPLHGEVSFGALESRLADSKSTLHAFVEKMENAIISGDRVNAEAMIDREAILKRSTGISKFDGVETVRQLFCESTNRAWDGRGVMKDYLQTKFTFLRPLVLAGRPGLLFRSCAEKGGLNYALFTLTEPAEGDYRIADIFVVGLNEFLSDTLHRTWMNVAGSFLDEESSGLTGVNRDYVSNMTEIAAASRLASAGRLGDALAAIRELPQGLQNDRSILLMRIEAAERYSMDERTDAYEAWLEAYPDEMNLPLKLADYYGSKGRWKDAQRVLSGLIDRIGTDMCLRMELGTTIYRDQRESAVVVASQVATEVK